MATGKKTLQQRIEWCRALLSEFRPQTVRQVYYVAISEGWLPPDTAHSKRRSYKAIQHALEQGRRRGVIPWEWVVDVGRVYRRNFTEKSLADFAREAPYYYTPMADHGCVLWVEKDTIVPTLEDIASDYICPLVSGRGFVGLSHIHKVALDLEGSIERVLFVGDHDPSGMVIDESLEANLLTEFGADWQVDRIALTWEQAHGLPSLKLKDTDTRTPGYEARYGPRAWEVEALPVAQLRQIVTAHLSEHFPDKSEFEQRVEEERQQIREALSHLAE